MKFHDNILNCFQVIERTRNYHSLISEGNYSKNVKTRFILWAACRLMMLYIPMKIHENTLNGFQVIEWT